MKKHNTWWTSLGSGGNQICTLGWNSIPAHWPTDMETCQIWVETGTEKSLAGGITQLVAQTVITLEDERWGLHWKHVDGHMEVDMKCEDLCIAY